GDGTGRFVHFPPLDADQPVLDQIEASDTLSARALVENLDRLQHGDLLAVDGYRHACFEGDQYLVRLARDCWISGIGVDVLDGSGPDVLQEPSLDSTAP